MDEKKLEEIFNEYCHKADGGKYMYLSHFIRAVNKAIQVEAKVKPEIAEVIKMINEEWRTVDSYDKTTFRAMYNKDRELSDFAKLVLESLKEKIEKQFSV